MKEIIDQIVNLEYVLGVKTDEKLFYGKTITANQKKTFTHRIK